jgi:hypothetical protein
MIALTSRAREEAGVFILLAVKVCSYAYIDTANNASIIKCAQYKF